MSKQVDEFNELAREIEGAAEQGGVTVDFRSVLQQFNNLAEKSGPVGDAPAQTAAQTAADERAFGERLTELVQERIGEAVVAAKNAKMEAISKPHAQKVKTVAAQRNRKKPKV